MSRALRTLVLAALLGATGLPNAALAADTWTHHHPGIDHLLRVDAGQVIHVARIDLSRSELSIRVTREGEGIRTPSSAASLLDAAVLINGDWSTAGGTRPYGLSVGNGWPWTDAMDPPSPPDSPDHWLFMACSSEKECFFDAPGEQSEWLYVWQNVVGGNEAQLVRAGVPQYYSGPFYTSERNPRSGVCLDSSGSLMSLIVVQGRRPDSLGMTFTEMADLMVDLGCHDGMMLDGGGSSGLVIDGVLVNSRPDNEPAERVVTNHLAILRTPSFHPDCVATPNGRFCDGSEINHCHGGQLESADCSVFGLACEEGLGTAYCVDPRCSNGAHQNTCESTTVMGTCQWGQYLDFDCSNLFGASCEEGGGSAYCVDPRCIHGGNANWCAGDVSATCIDGFYTTEDCRDSGMECDGGACVPASGDDDTTGDDDTSGDDDTGDDDDSAVAGDDDSAGDDDDGDDDAEGDDDTSNDDPAGNEDESARPETETWECACEQGATPTDQAGAALLALWLLAIRIRGCRATPATRKTGRCSGRSRESTRRQTG